MVPYFAYDFNEKKQKSIVRVLKVRALFEDYGNGITKDADLVEGIDIIRNAREMAATGTPLSLDKKAYKKNGDATSRKEAKKAYKEALKFNEEIEIAKFVCAELDKFSSAEMQKQVNECKKIVSVGINGLIRMDIADLKRGLKNAKVLSKNTPAEKEYRNFKIDMAKNMLTSYKTIKKYYKDASELVQPDFKILDAYYDREDEIDNTMKALYLEDKKADKLRRAEIKSQIKELKKEKNELKKNIKAEMDKHANFDRVAKPFIVAEKLVKQQENYTHFDDIAAKYEEAKQRSEAERAEKLAEQERAAEKKTSNK